MMRLLHMLAITALIASAAYAYSIKYDTLFYSEQVAKLTSKIEKERSSISVLRAEWQLLNNPDRLQTAAEQHLDLQVMEIKQLARWSDIPARPARGDEIGMKLQALGLVGTSTPRDKNAVDVGVTGAISPPATPRR